MLFDKSLLALGNVQPFSLLVEVFCTKVFLQILFISGLGAVIGRERTFRFFFQRHKIKGSVAFFGGIIIVLVGWPLVGMIFEGYGFFLLFRYAPL